FLALPRQRPLPPRAALLFLVRAGGLRLAAVRVAAAAQEGRRGDQAAHQDQRQAQGQGDSLEPRRRRRGGRLGRRRVRRRRGQGGPGRRRDEGRGGRGVVAAVGAAQQSVPGERPGGAQRRVALRTGGALR